MSPATLTAAIADLRPAPGNPIRRFVVQNSRSEPWSQAERRFHMFLRAHGYDRWRSNVWVGIDGDSFPLDVLFDDLPLAVEVMSWAFHGNRENFQRDNDKIAGLVGAGWVYFPVTWRMLDDDERLTRTFAHAWDSAALVSLDQARRVRDTVTELGLPDRD